MAARKWTINGRFLTQPMSGVQRYAEEITRSIDGLIADGHPLASSLEIEILCPPKARDLLGLRALTLKQVGTSGGHKWEQTELPRHASDGLLSLGNSGPLAKSRQIVCIHDMNTRLFPSSYSKRFRLLYGALLPALGRRAARIATVSHFSASQIVRFGVARADKIDVMPDGHEHVFAWKSDLSAAVQSAAQPDVIALIGSPAPHKNAALILSMASELEALGLKIAVAGGRDSRVFQNSGAITDAANVLWLGQLTNEELAAVLQNCLCLAFPSFTEGFGLPPLEAMALGCPVVVTDQASLPEVCGDAALYASPHDKSAWLKHFATLRDDASQRRRLIKAGHEQVRRFSWRQSAELYLEAMAKVDAAGP
ncbi:MAG: glycosyltransferase family 1 protein [Hyphomicrobiales bacterium]|nr:glycosyltransferase family 1 protein [Hyphomicrobiales bacterium]